jgi:hypothetical protein
VTLLNRYQTGAWTTLLLFIGIAVSFAWGVFRVVHRHDRGGYLESAICLIVLYTFDKNYRRRTESLKTGQE